MGTTPTMNVSLTPELKEFVAGKVDEGTYGSASEVVREALRLLVEREQERELKLAYLKARIAEGADESGDAELDMDAFIRAK